MRLGSGDRSRRARDTIRKYVSYFVSDELLAVVHTLRELWSVLRVGLDKPSNELINNLRDTLTKLNTFAYPFSWVKAGMQDKYQKAKQLTKTNSWQASVKAVN